jgi:hypothetical protein
MAWIASATANLIMFFRDDDGAISRHTIHIPIGDMNNAVAVAKQYGELIKAVSDCVLWKMHIEFGAWSDGPQRGAAGSSIKQQSVFVFATTDSRFVLAVPGVIASKLMAAPDPYAGVQLDSSDVDIAALVYATTNGIGVALPVAPWNPDLTGEWGSGGGGGGSFGGGGGGGSFGGGGGGGSFGGGGGGGSWGWGWSEGGGGGGGGSIGPWDVSDPGGEFTWIGDRIVSLRVAYKGYDLTRPKR